jgi:hypothetical protein
MKMRLLSIALVACGVFLSIGPELPVLAERPDAAVQTDFDALHEQANIALQNLRQSRERRMASASTVAF